MKSVYFSLSILLTGALTAAVVSATDSGYGYGYGTTVTTCTGAAPSGITIQQRHTKRQVVVDWDAATFTDCTQTTADHYVLDVRTNSGHVVKTYEAITRSKKTIPSRQLKWNYSYKVRVRAVAVDDTNTEWSDYHLFRSTPKAVSHVKTTWQAEQLVYLSWDNIARSNALRYYQITVWHDNKRLTRKKVHTGLSSSRTGAYLRTLQRGERYRITIRSVYSGTVYSKDVELIVE